MLKFSEVNYKNYNDVLRSILKSLGYSDEDGFSLFVRMYTFHPFYSNIEPEWDLNKEFLHETILYQIVNMLNATLNGVCPLADTNYLLNKEYCNMLMVFLSCQRDFFNAYNLFFTIESVNMNDIKYLDILADIERSKTLNGDETRKLLNGIIRVKEF